MKIILFVLGVFISPVLSHADPLHCRSQDGTEITATIFTRAQVALIETTRAGKVYRDMARFELWGENNVGHSRCPGSWGGTRFQTTGAGPFQSLTVTREENFSGCGGGLVNSGRLTWAGQVIEVRCDPPAFTVAKELSCDGLTWCECLNLRHPRTQGACKEVR